MDTRPTTSIGHTTVTSIPIDIEEMINSALIAMLGVAVVIVTVIILVMLRKLRQQIRRLALG